MARLNYAGAYLALAAGLLVSDGVHAASRADKCEAAKLKISAKYNSCLLKAQAKAVKNPAAEISGDLAKCDTTFTDKWAKAEKKGGGACPTSGDAGSTQALVRELSVRVGDRFKPVAFTDNGDGTITDNFTGLMWEKKDGDDGVANYGDPSDVDNVYTWTRTDIMPDGTAFTEFLGQLNNCYLNAAGPTIVGGLGGHCDWRIPSITELNSIVSLSAPGCGDTFCSVTSSCPGHCIGPVFGPSSNAYFSNTGNGGIVYIGEFSGGFSVGGLISIDKNSSSHVRAVRGGS